MEISKNGIYLKSCNRFFPWAQNVSVTNNRAEDTVLRLSNILIFDNYKCDVDIYTKCGGVYYVDVHVSNQSKRRKDMIASFRKIENKLKETYGAASTKHWLLSWFLGGSALSKRKINPVLVEHHLYEHFDYREGITIKLV